MVIGSRRNVQKREDKEGELNRSVPVDDEPGKDKETYRMTLQVR